MKKILLLISIGFLAFSCNFIEQQTLTKPAPIQEPVTIGFVSGSEDIPLYKNLTQINDETLGFDSGSGSISVASYSSTTDLEDVKIFYLKTLPEMGWRLDYKTVSQMKFIRGNEKVEINFISKNGENVVKFVTSSAL